MIVDEARRIYHSALNQFQRGLLFYYFSTSDRTQHMFWRTMDPQHPAHDARSARDYGSAIEDCYQTCDGIVGDALEACDSDTTLVVLSDHGFAPLYRKFNLNTWLRDNGYLGPPDCTSVLANADWSESRAFGLGLNGLYLNLKGRERYGIVEPGEKDQLLDELVAKLEAVGDRDGRRVIRKVHHTDKAYSGPASKYAPDLVIGYSRDFRYSWKTALGDITDEVLLDNDSAWAADHCMDASEVPGVLFSNQPIAAPDPSLVDLAPSILTEFGLKIPSTMVGRNIFET